MAKAKGDEEPWDRKKPDDGKKKKTTLTPASRQKAKTRARAAGRKYPNLVDNMWATQEQPKRKNAKKKTAAGKKKVAAAGKSRSTKTAGAAKKTAGAKKKTAAAKKRTR